jgi:hypothetical protein
MTDFIIKKLPYDLTSNAGLALVGQYFKRLEINQRIDTQFPLSGKGIANSDILKSYRGLLVQGKNDFDAIEAFRGDAFFSRSLGIGAVPSSPALRQRMDTTHSADWFELVDEFNFTLLSAKRECIWSEMLELKGAGNAANPARRIYRLTERTLDKEGQVMLMAHYTLDGCPASSLGRAFTGHQSILCISAG